MHQLQQVALQPCRSRTVHWMPMRALRWGQSCQLTRHALSAAFCSFHKYAFQPQPQDSCPRYHAGPLSQIQLGTPVCRFVRQLWLPDRRSCSPPGSSETGRAHAAVRGLSSCSPSQPVHAPGPVAVSPAQVSGLTSTQQQQGQAAGRQASSSLLA